MKGFENGKTQCKECGGGYQKSNRYHRKRIEWHVEVRWIGTCNHDDCENHKHGLSTSNVDHENGTGVQVIAFHPLRHLHFNSTEVGLANITDVWIWVVGTLHPQFEAVWVYVAFAIANPFLWEQVAIVKAYHANIIVHRWRSPHPPVWSEGYLFLNLARI